MTEQLGAAGLGLFLLVTGLYLTPPGPSPQEPVATSEFTWVDVHVDSGDAPLAAWQIELSSDDPGLGLVGVEGGETAVFREAPRYDPRALQQRRIILASFTTAPPEELPRGRTRVARIHLELRGGARPDLKLQPIVAAREDGREIAVTVTLEKGR